MYFLNKLLHVLHLGIILFCLFAWIVPELLIYHFILCVLTLISWFVIGIAVKKPGLCVVTAIQQKLRNKINVDETIENYIHFLIKKGRGVSFKPHKIDYITQSFLYTLTALSIYLNFM